MKMVLLFSDNQTCIQSDVLFTTFLVLNDAAQSATFDGIYDPASPAPPKWHGQILPNLKCESDVSGRLMCTNKSQTICISS